MKIDNFKVEDWFNKYEKLAKYDMADTCVESLSLNGLFDIIGEKELLMDNILNKKLNYGDIQGSEELHKAIKTLYPNLSDEYSITTTHGAIGANNLVMKTLIEPGDKVVSIVPTYQQHYSIPKSLGAHVELVFLKEKNNWLVDIDELADIVGNNTKLICINNPNNPTGSVMDEERLSAVVDVAKKNNSYILCDEVYRGLEHNRVVTKSITEIYERGISTSSMSKVFSLAGLRLGWIVAPEDVINKIIIHREYDTISLSVLDDYFAMLALNNKDKIINRNISKILEGKKILKNWISNEPHISWVEPRGGTTCLLKYDMKIPSADLCKKLLKDTGVLFLPASTFEMEGYLRAGYCSDISNLKKGLDLFSKWIVF